MRGGATSICDVILCNTSGLQNRCPKLFDKRGKSRNSVPAVLFPFVNVLRHSYFCPSPASVCISQTQKSRKAGIPLEFLSNEEYEKYECNSE